MTNEEKQMSMDRRRMLAKLVLGGAAGLVAAACGGGGGDSKDESIDLRAALDRLHAGMTFEDVVAAVGAPPNDGPAQWDSGDQVLHVSFGAGTLDTPLISSAYWFNGSNNQSRVYV